MKTKNKIYLFAATLFFVSVFSVGVDGVNSVAKAECGDVAEDYDPGGCLYPLNVDNGVTIENDLASCSESYPGSIEDRGGSCSCPGGTEWNSDGDACVPLSANSGDDCVDENTSSVCCNIFGGTWGQNGVCYTDSNRKIETFMTQEECNTYGTGYIVSPDGYDCVPNATTGVTQKDCNELGSGYIVNNAGTDCLINGTGGVTQTECNSYGSGYILNDAGTDCYKPDGKKGDGCVQAAGFFSSDTCANGFTCGSRLVCEVSTIGELTGLGQGGTTTTTGGGSSLKQITSATIVNGKSLVGATYDPATRIATLSDGSRIPLTQAQVAGMTTVPVFAGTSGISCGAGFKPIGGICFPTNTGLAEPEYGISQILMSIFNWLMAIFTTLAVLAFVVSGIQYFMGAGNDSMVEAAKKNATNAVIGIIVGLSGFIIVQAISAMLLANGSLF